MSEKIAMAIKDKFTNLTGLDVRATYMPAPHKPTRLLDEECGVYVFLIEGCCFKVGKAGKGSKPRWNSHHYNLDEKTTSALTKSICAKIEKFEKCFPKAAHAQIRKVFLKEKQTKKWIMANLARIEFKMKASDNQKGFALTLLESLAQFELKPMFEGKDF